MSGWFLDDSPPREQQLQHQQGGASLVMDESSPARELEEIGSINGSPQPVSSGSTPSKSNNDNRASLDSPPRMVSVSMASPLAPPTKVVEKEATVAKEAPEGGPRKKPYPSAQKPREDAQSSSSSNSSREAKRPGKATTAWAPNGHEDFSDGDKSDPGDDDASADGSSLVNKKKKVTTVAPAGKENYARVAGIDPRLPVEEQLHLVWRKYSDHIYDFFAQHFLEYSSNTVAFVPNSRRRFLGADFAMHQMYLGTTSPNNDNYLMMYNVYTPAEVEDSDNEEMNETGQKGIEGSYTDVANMIQRTFRVSHDGPVIRARPSPFNPHLVCTRSNKSVLSVYDLEAISGGFLGGRDEISDGESYVDTANDGSRSRRIRRGPDLTRPSSVNGRTVQCDPTLVLRGPQRAGVGLEWHPTEANVLAATSYDQKVYLYDLEGSINNGEEEDPSPPSGAAYRGNQGVSATSVLKGHSEEVYDVSWHHTHRDILLSSGSEGKVLFWDRRTATKTMSAELHKCPVLASKFHPTGQFAFATGSMDGPVRVWDFRALTKPVFSLVAHRGPVSGIHWAPFSDSVLMSHSTDGSIVIWDLLKASQDPQPCDENANPELVFQHHGHSSPVRDACWCADGNDAWTVVGVDDHNTVQIWSPAPKIINDFTDPDLEV